MKKIILKALLISVFITLCSFVSANASTSDVFDDTYFNTYGKAYGSGLLAPNVIPNDDYVDVTRGETTICETDYTIPGKNGFGIPIIRSHSVDISKGYYEECWYNTKQDYVRYVGYYYTDTTSGKSIIIAFDNEFDAFSKGKTFTGASKTYLDGRGYGQSDSQHSYYFQNQVIRNASKDPVTYVLDETKSAVNIIGNSYEVEKLREITNTKHHLKIGEGWTIKKSGILIDDIIISDEDFYSVFTFQDIHGRAYHAEAEFERINDELFKYRRLTNVCPNPFLISMSFVNPEDIQTFTTHPAGFTYNATITTDFGEKYYFYATSYNTYRLVAISDKYGNSILVDVTDDNIIKYTDDAGNEYTVSASGITKSKNGSVTTLVSYDFEFVNSDNDNGDYFDCDDKAQFTLKKITDENQDISLSEDVTIYLAKQSLDYNLILSTRGASYIIGCYITDILYPTGVHKNYDYVYYNKDTYSNITENRVSEFYETHNNTNYNRKTFTYERNALLGSVRYPGLTSVTHYKNENTTSGMSEKYYIDTYGRLVVKSVSYGTGYGSIENAYNYDSNYYQAPIKKDMVAYPGGSSLTNNYSYNTSNLITQRSSNNNVLEKTTYGNHNIVTSNHKYRDSENYIKTLNTITSDGNSIACTQVFDNDDLKSQTSYTYDSFGNITSETVMRNNDESYTITYNHTYNSEGEKTTVSTVSGIKDADNNILSDATASVTINAYGDVLSQTDALGNTTAYEYDIQRRLTKEIFPDGTTCTYEYDIDDNIIYVTDAKNTKMKYKYNPWGQLEEVGYYENNVYNILEKRIYDYRHNLTEYRKYSDDSTYVKAVYTYNSFNSILTEQVFNASNQEVRKTEYTYSFSGQAETTTTAKVSENGRSFALNEKKVNYFGYTLYEKQTSSDNAVRQYTYTNDLMGNVLSVTKPDNSTESYVYEHLGKLTSFTNSLGDTMYYSYDMAGNNTAVTDFNGNTTNYIYDALGRQIKTVMPFSDTATSTTKTYYDANGNVIKKSVQNNAEGEDESYRSIDYVYDNMNRLSYTVEHPTVITNEYTQYFYDANGNIRNVVKGLTAPVSSFSQRPSSSKYLTYSYDALNRNTYVGGSLASTGRHFTYDRCGNVITSTNGSNTVNYTYDPFGNVLTVQGGTDASKYISYSYNALGLRTQMVDETGTTNYAYNDFGELISETKGGIVKTSGYNNMGMRTSFSVTNNGSSLLSNTYAYDTLGRMTSVTQGLDVVSYAYDNNGNLTQRNTDGHITTYTYNKANLRTSDSWGNYGYTSREYVYYLDGNLKLSDTGFDTSYTYDNKNRLVSSRFTYSDMEEVYETYEYNIFDDITRKTTVKYNDYGNDEDNGTFITEYEYLPEYNYINQSDYKMVDGVKKSCGGIDFIYDENGNLINKWPNIVPGEESKAFSYTYDYLGRLTSVYENNVLAHTYTYDGDNLRQTKNINGNPTAFVLDGMNVVAETGNQNTITYLRGNGLEGYLKNGTSRKYYYNEPNGSTYIIYGDESNNYEPVGEYAYGGFGNLIWDNWQETSFAYAGEYHDDETGFIYLRNRYYDPSIGRFISEDPIRSGTNWYVYANNNPVKFTDSMGLDAELDEYVKNNYSGKVTVTIAAQRPVENSRIAVNLDEGDVGHTFVRIDYGDGRVIYRGFYPSRGLTTEEILTKADVMGDIVDDSEHDWNAAVTYEITAKQADKMVQFIEDYDKKYNMVTNNCTTFGVQVLKVGGLTAPTSKHKWTLPDNARQMVIDNLSTDKWFKGATADYLIGGLKGYSPADAVQDFKNVPKYVLKYGGTTHICTNTGKSR